MSLISIVIPCYFNEENIPVTFEKLQESEKLYDANVSFEYIFVDDGSKDDTYKVLKELYQAHSEKIKVVKLVRNVGSYVAIKAGLEKAKGDCCTIISADLQDPPEMIHKMFRYWEKGIKLVMANRQKRNERFFSKLFSNTYHSLIRKFALKNIPKGGFDFVLFDKKLNEELLQIKEKNTNTLYLLSWLGYDSVSIPYERRKREIGKSRWTLSKKIKLFIDSFVSFSFVPIRAISFFGIIFGVLAILFTIYILFAKLTGLIDTEGYTTLITVVLFIGAFQMFGIGIIGEYVWRVLDEARNRPEFTIDEFLEKSNNQ